MRTLAVGLLCFLFMQSCSSPPFSLNYKDKKGKRQGLWKVYFSDGNLYYKVRYKNNIPKGKMKYYYQSGAINCVEHYKKNNTDIPTVYYHENGKVELKGLAELITKSDTVAYRWKGQWHKFDSIGNLIEVITYRHGHVIGSKKITN